jgi:Peptidase family S41
MTERTRPRTPRALRRTLFAAANAAASIVLAAAVAGASGAPAPGALTGFWKSDGYGYVFDAKGEGLQAYEVTKATCVRSFEAKRKRKASEPAGAEAVYEDGDEVFIMKPTPDPDVKRLHYDGAASDMVIRRVPALPPVCTALTPDTPEANFQVFAETWAEHYILFDEKRADWPAAVAAARTKVTRETKPEELFAVLEGMIAPLEDAHTFIRAKSLDRRFRTFRRGTDNLMKDGREAFEKKVRPAVLAVTDKKLQGKPRTWCNEQVQYGHLDETTGYLRLLSEGGYTKDGRFDSGLTALESALDAIFEDPHLQALVIDVRINTGGADPYGLALASRLATSEYVAYSKEARLDPVDRTKWTPGQPSIVRKSTRPSFHGPVVELIGPFTISAGETTTQALMGRTPKVLRIGESTQGVFSDVLVRRLPNGWDFGLPNEVFRSPDGKTFDGAGIPPDVTVPVFAAEDLAAGRDPALERARAELKRSVSR